ncbi:MAG: hypothetical protein GX366_04055 [Epulopiscium sp.]|nr:hypothetical protein [Candidatus Epulonipiscium sp.]
MLIKSIGMACILIGATTLGWCIDRIQLYRIEDLEGIRSILYMLHSEVNYSITPLPTALREIIDKSNSRVNCIFTRLLSLIEDKTSESITVLWEKAVKSELPKTYLEEEDKKTYYPLDKPLDTWTRRCRRKT